LTYPYPDTLTVIIKDNTNITIVASSLTILQIAIIPLILINLVKMFFLMHQKRKWTIAINKWEGPKVSKVNQKIRKLLSINQESLPKFTPK